MSRSQLGQHGEPSQSPPLESVKRPGGEINHEHPSRVGEHAGHFLANGLTLQRSQLVQHQRGGDDVEHRVLERNPLGVSEPKVSRGAEPLAGPRKHRWRGVDPRHVAACGGVPLQLGPGPAADIEHP